jgi:BASS family bile acid:Na+ symporter
MGVRQIAAPLFYVNRFVYFCGMKLIQFAKDWTLPVSMGIGALAYFIFAYTPALHDAALFFDPIFDTILPLFMFMILFVTFCKVDFKQMKTEMWHLWIVLLQVLLVLIVVGIILFTEQTTFSKIVWEGILTCIICPTAAAAAVITVKLGGNLGSMTTYTFISSFVTAILIPTFFPLIEKEAHLTFWDAFLIILNKVCLVLVLPLFLGWFVRHFVKPLHDKIVAVKDMGF